jgi:hypothetical protein
MIPCCPYNAGFFNDRRAVQHLIGCGVPTGVRLAPDPEGETTWRIMVAWQRSLSENCTAAFAKCRAMHRALRKVQCDMGLLIVVLPGSKVVVGMRKHRKRVSTCSVCCIQLILCGDLLTS